MLILDSHYYSWTLFFNSIGFLAKTLSKVLCYLISMITFGYFRVIVESGRKGSNPVMLQISANIKSSKWKFIPFKDSGEINGPLICSFCYGFIYSERNQSDDKFFTQMIILIRNKDRYLLENCQKTDINKYSKITISLNRTVIRKNAFSDDENIVPTKSQKKIIDFISDKYEKDGFSATLLIGPAKTGKTTIASLLAKKYGGTLCDQLTLSLPGFSIMDIYNETIPKKNKPLIFSFSDFETEMREISAGMPQMFKYLRRAVFNSSTLATTMDSLSQCRNTIFIFSTNDETILELDKSNTKESKYIGKFLRPGRIESYFYIDEVINTGNKFYVDSSMDKLKKNTYIENESIEEVIET